MVLDFIPKTKKCFDPNLYNERRFEELFNKGEVLKRHNDRNVNKLDAYERLLHYMISNIIIPNVAHKYSITNMHSFVMLALHEHRKMNFGFMTIEHMLATQTSSTKCLPYGCFLTKVFQYFVLNLVGVDDHIGIEKIFNKHTFKRMGFSRNEEGMLVREKQEKEEDDDDDDDDDDEGKDAMHMDEKFSEEELEKETFRREMRQKKRKERVLKRSDEYNEDDTQKMTLNFQAINILCCALDAMEYNRVNGCKTAIAIWKL
ncbi:hypothetical protein M9H77_29472 [Catharanthus roseus]|uniref:Uncharacterized protein n=1 Tax=Catharanthus roseus TaxID=4058 RepID=A0ACB9ZUI5_CATRO|nr:hypothetical protein M9H77_29472 [Catharanthus roseus]